MQIIPYVPIPKLKVVGASLFVLGIATVGVIGLVYHNSGEVVAEVETTQPLPKTDMTQQAMQAMSQSYLQNKMNKMGLPTFKTDEIETLSFDFPPVRLTPEMGKVTFLFEVKGNGIIANNNMTWTDQGFISTDYMIKDHTTHTIVYNDKKKLKITVNPDEKNHHATISYNGQDKKMTSQSSIKYQTVTSLVVPQDSDYVLQANVQKFKFAYPIDSIKLIVKKGMMEQPSFKMICSLIGIILLGAILCIMATPPEERKAKRKSNPPSRPF